MGIIVKKAGRKVRFAFFSMISFILVAVIKLFLGNSFTNLKQLESKANDVMHTPGSLVSGARADVPEPPPPPTSCNCCGSGS